MRVRNVTSQACAIVAAFLCATLSLFAADTPDLIVHHGKIVSVDDHFSIQEAMALREGKIVALGSNADILQTMADQTRVIDLGGKTVLPGLIDSHTHPTGASMTEFEHAIPDFETIQEVLDYIQARAQAQPAGEWIVLNATDIPQWELDRVGLP